MMDDVSAYRRRASEEPVMSIRVAISDPLPAYRHGMLVSLGDAGFQPEAPRDLLQWAVQEPRRAILMTLDSQEDWALLAELQAAGADVPVVAAIPEGDVALQVRAVVTGAIATVSRGAPPESVQRVLEAAVDGVSMLPVEVVRALAARQLPLSREPRVSRREIQWLQALAKGQTVSQLAEHAGYSERAMFRLLRDLYARMGVGGRTEALMHAHQQGWL
jgi:DNA-binding NarL/FixJ family response regulator